MHTFSSEQAQPRAAHRWVHWTLIAFGLACLVLYAAFTVQAALYQRRAKAEINRMIAARHSSAAPPVSAAPEIAESPTMTRPSPAPTSGVPLARGTVIGRIDVPRLQLSAAVAEGDDDSTLRKAVGHLPETPLPWQPGNVALAGHRDALFRPLRDIRIDDEVKLVTSRGDFLYRVRQTRIVNPDDVFVLAPTSQPSLTLITCYPFSFVGHAPQRFIVQAERVEPDLPGFALKGTVAP